MSKDHINKKRSAVLSEKSKDSCAYLNHSWLAIVLYHTAKFQQKYLEQMLRFHSFGPNQAHIAHLPKKDIFGGIPFNIFDIAVMSHHQTKFKKILRVDSKNKTIKFFGPKLGQK